MNPLDRRKFLGRLPVLPVLASAAAAASSACAGVPRIAAQPSPQGMFVPLSALSPQGDALVDLPGEAVPLFVRRSDDGVTAVRLLCTHRGCQPDPEADRLVCPCHGSEFAFDGKVLNGPASEPLDRFPARLSGTRIVVSIP